MQIVCNVLQCRENRGVWSKQPFLASVPMIKKWLFCKCKKKIWTFPCSLWSTGKIHLVTPLIHWKSSGFALERKVGDFVKVKYSYLNAIGSLVYSSYLLQELIKPLPHQAYSSQMVILLNRWLYTVDQLHAEAEVQDTFDLSCRRCCNHFPSLLRTAGLFCSGR